MKRSKTIKVLIIILLILILTATAAYKIMNSRTFQFFGGIVNRMDTSDKVVALTFDDGPSSAADAILSILDSENITATFFLIGSDIEKYPNETRKLISAGQAIGNHTYPHDYLVFKSLSAIKTEIEKTDKLIREAGYNDPIQFRPPYCKKLLFLPYYLKKQNRKTILWDLEPNSYPEFNTSSEKIVKYVVDNVQPGSIILLHPWHDNNGATIGSLRGIIEGLREKGYEFKTVNEMLANSE
jgi:chitin deacetylase